MILKRQNMGTTRGDIIRNLKQPNQIPEAFPKITRQSLNQISDAEGLKKAYQQPNHIYIDKHKMFIAGSKSIRDWVDNAAFIPPSLTTYHNIYQSANDSLKQNPQVNEIIGHSAGGAVLLELEKQYPNRFNKTRTYSAPVFNPFGNEALNENRLRFRTTFDPVAAFDNNAITINKNSLNPFTNHSYENYFDTGKDTGYQII